MDQKTQSNIAFIISAGFFIAYTFQPIFIVFAIPFLIGGIVIRFTKPNTPKEDPAPAAQDNIDTAAIPQAAPLTKSENFRIAGLQYYSKEIMQQLSLKNEDYSLPKKDLTDIYDEGDRIFQYEFNNTPVKLVQEPDNEHDPNAIAVFVDTTKIGYIKKGSCSHVKNLLRSEMIEKTEIEITGGDYKALVYSDESILIDKDSQDLRATLTITYRINSHEGEPQ